MQIKNISSIALCTILVSGCGNDMNELEQYVGQIKKNPPGAITNIPVIKIYPKHEYQGSDKDPFYPGNLAGVFTEAKPVGPVEPKTRTVIDNIRSREYLEGYPLDSLAMVGTLAQQGDYWALIQTTDGTVQRVGAGNYMGKNVGIIHTITESEVMLTEKIDDRVGGVVEREASMVIPEKSW